MIKENPCKRRVIITVVAIVLVIVVGLFVYLLIVRNAEQQYPWSIDIVSPNLDTSLAEGVLFTVDEKSITRYSGTFTIFNNESMPVPLGGSIIGAPPYFLQININGEWREIDDREPFNNATWRAALKFLAPSESHEAIFHWHLMYGALPNGLYRVVVPLGSSHSSWDGMYLICEFTISDHT